MAQTRNKDIIFPKETRYCTECSFRLMEDEHFEDDEGQEYCYKCAEKLNIKAKDMKEDSAP